MKNSLKTSLVLVLILVSSCSTMKIGYNWADYLLYRRIDNFFDINSDQEDFVESGLKKLHSWHRKEELPKYREYLIRIKKTVKRGNVKEDDLSWFYKNIREYFRSIAAFAEPDSVKFLYSLSDDQIRYFEKMIAERNEEEALKLKREPEKRYEEALEKAIEEVEDWTGDLSDSQRKEVEKKAFFKKEEDELRLENQKRSQKRFVEILKNRADFQTFKEKINDWFFNYRRFHTEEYSKILSEKREARKELILLMDKIATEKQRAHTIERLDEYIGMIDALMEKKD